MKKRLSTIVVFSRYWLFAILFFAVNTKNVLGQNEEDETIDKSYVVVYLIMICCIGLALSLIVRTGGKPRTIDFHHEDPEKI